MKGIIFLKAAFNAAFSLKEPRIKLTVFRA
jgi:hypothetical protein